MSELTPAAPHSTDLTISPEQTGFTDKQVAALRQLGVQGASPADLAVFFHQAVRTGLDPFARQIYMISREVNEKDERGQWTKVHKQTIQTGIDGFRLIARRATDRAHGTLGFQPTEWCGQDGVWRDVWLTDEPPAAARVVVLRDGQPYPGMALLSEYAGRKRDGSLTSMWASKPALMLAKCAEALALRRAFPQDLSGIYTSDEMAAASNPTTIPGRVQQAEDETAPQPAEMTPLEYAGVILAEAQAAPTVDALNDVWRDMGKRLTFSWRAAYPRLRDYAEDVVVELDGATLTLMDAFQVLRANIESGQSHAREDIVDAEVVTEAATTTRPTRDGAERVTVNDVSRAADEDLWATPGAGVPAREDQGRASDGEG